MSKQYKTKFWRKGPKRAAAEGTSRSGRLAGATCLAAVSLLGGLTGSLGGNFAGALAVGGTATAQTAITAAPLSSRLLSVADLPHGWSVAPAIATKASQVTTSPCGAALVAVLVPPGLPKSAMGPPYATRSFVEGTALPNLRETLASGAPARETWKHFDAALAGCRGATFVYKGTKVLGTGKPLLLPRLGRGSSAYAWALGVAGSKGGSSLDLIFFQTANNYYGYLSYFNVGPPLVPTVMAFARAAVAKATAGSTARVPDAVSIASTPVQTVHTALGTVGYRSIGAGPPLVLVSGWSATMEYWSPLLVDILAQHYRVITFDNAGVGRTQDLPAPLTIDALANQTAAFIQALHLGRPDVLGSSMGTAIVQALAVLHPNEVRRLVLCEPYPGNGAVVLPPKAVLDAKNDPTALFPADQTDAEIAYGISISSYPKAPPAPAATNAAQLKAIHQWWAGDDPTGRLVSRITAPTLLADGTVDRLDPVANTHLLARLIRGAKVKLYPDAGHAFLFQDYSAFADLVVSFLGPGAVAMNWRGQP